MHGAFFFSFHLLESRLDAPIIQQNAELFGPASVVGLLSACQITRRNLPLTKSKTSRVLVMKLANTKPH